ncbi:transposase [Streptomyces sp. SID625]|nr:transposase [Streptomyces sp. SID625]
MTRKQLTDDKVALTRVRELVRDVGCEPVSWRKSPYPEEFRNDAVVLYRAAGGKRTYAAVAADVGLSGETLRSWVRQADEQAGRDHSRGEQGVESRDEELARLRAENGRLRKAENEWELEREILRRAAACFAREMK